MRHSAGVFEPALGLFPSEIMLRGVEPLRYFPPENYVFDGPEPLMGDPFLFARLSQ